MNSVLVLTDEETDMAAEPLTRTAAFAPPKYDDVPFSRCCRYIVMPMPFMPGLRRLAVGSGPQSADLLDAEIHEGRAPGRLVAFRAAGSRCVVHQDPRIALGAWDFDDV